MGKIKVFHVIAWKKFKIFKICKYENKSENFFVIKTGVEKMWRNF